MDQETGPTTFDKCDDWLEVGTKDYPLWKGHLQFEYTLPARQIETANKSGGSAAALVDRNDEPIAAANDIKDPRQDT